LSTDVFTEVDTVVEVCFKTILSKKEAGDETSENTKKMDFFMDKILAAAKLIAAAFVSMS